MPSSSRKTSSKTTHVVSAAPGATLRSRLLAGALALAVAWAGGATYYLVFHDEVLARFVSQQSAIQYGYEERIGALRLQLDRVTMEQAAARDGIAQRMAELARRQAAMEARQAVLANLAGETGAAALPPPAVEIPEPAPRPLPGGKPFPTPDGLRLRTDAETMPGRQSARAAESRIAALEQRLDGLAEAQSRVLANLGLRAGKGAQRLRQLVVRLGLDPARFEHERPAGIGGPLVPLSDAFGASLADVQRSIAEEAHLRRITAGLPVRRPLSGELSLSSNFGARLDPFTRGYAMHTGMDMRAETGEPARATAAGRVTVADYNGGYGNMVEVDHGHGLVTRYAHLSAFDVTPGQWVEPGTIVGRVGSTGRSTGSHLHYETRIDGEPVDPVRFLRAAEAL
ncbi:peptidase M23 [Methylobacterium sp. Leaf104]|uniref:peptidoglycan DD-metalloendopeptidase family protein n=1 Tax=Methylobacterium TaxID=407 RepID=UPI0006FA617E|nr:MULTISPECIES: peptidoglycan DD-metalloendopeptidase family protein [Methylobacterium]KQP31755.1 peptidase M23 [Methylobacterium sp. Leaf104]MCI9880674.1 peptidoglycan DD-metalloendopeptidase family protein [Methylobacterium goesingense]